VKFEVERHDDVLLVPNAALRWQPRPDQIVPDARVPSKAESFDKENAGDKAAASSDVEKSPVAEKWESEAGKAASGEAKADARPSAKGRRSKARDQHGMLWVKDGNYVRPIEVRKGASDDQDTEVSGDGLQDGMEVVVGEIHATDQTAEENNPFAPRFFRGNRPRPGGASGAKGAK